MQQSNVNSQADNFSQTNKGHTMLLIQFTGDLASKTFLDYDDISKCVDGVCQLYEQKLKI